MKQILLTSLIVLRCFLTFGQIEAQKFKLAQLQNKGLSQKELSASLDSFDFSKIFTQTDNSMVYGFIGDNYQRIRIKFITVIKNESSPDTYIIYGKSMVKNYIHEFHGNITITNIRKKKVMSYGVDDECKNKGFKGEYVILGDYNFNESETQAHSGTFKGTFQSFFYKDKNNKVHYDDIENYSDNYKNNQFVGQWVSYKGNLAKRCNWGDFRIPNSGDFDIGAGEFSPNTTTLSLGWQTVHDLWGSKLKKEKAKQIEEAKWWK
jgi:hypothetical protein